MKHILKKCLCVVISLCIVVGTVSVVPTYNVFAEAEDINVTPNPATGTTTSGTDVVFTNTSGYSSLDGLKAAGYTKYEVTFTASVYTGGGGCMPYLNTPGEWYHVWYNIEPNKETTVSIDLAGKSGQLNSFGIQFSGMEGTISYKIISAKFIYTGEVGPDNPDDPDDPDDPVDTDVNYAKLLQESLYFYDANMCGEDVGEKTAYSWRGDCHLGDISVYCDVTGKSYDISGGYHDAGDHAKFGLPQAYAATMLGLAYYDYKDDFEELGQSAHVLMHLDRFADYFKKCTIRDNNGKTLTFCYQVGNGVTDHEYWGKPEDQDTSQGNRSQQGYFTKASVPCTDIVSETAAYLAMYSLIRNDSESLEVAESLIKYAEDNDKVISHDAPGAYKGDGSNEFYRGSSYEDDMANAYYWLYAATKSNDYLTKYNNYISKASDGWVQCWDEMWSSALLVSNNAKIGTQINKFKNGQIGNVTGDGFNCASGWGSTRYNVAMQFMALDYDRRNNKSAYSAWAAEQMDYILGNNNKKICYVIGYSSNSAKHPHHRAASGYTGWDYHNNNMLPQHTIIGTLIGGPDETGGYVDSANQFRYSEVALDFQSSFVGALIALYHVHKNDEELDLSLATEEELEALEITKYYGKSEPDPEHEHSLNHHSAQAASCNKEGNIEYWYCTECKKFFSDAAAENEISYEDTIIEMTPHTPGDVEYSWKDDYSKATASIKCKKCGETLETETVSSTFVETKPTCTANGKFVYSASFENEKFADQTKIVILQAEGHKTVHYPAVASTCEVEGNIEYWKCSVCNKYFSDELGMIEIAQSDIKLDLGDHDWGEWVVTKEATETEEGEETRVCKTNSNHKETRSIPPIGHTHNFNKVNEIAATCENAGNKEYYTCDDCGLIFIKDGENYRQCNTEDVNVPALGHDFGSVKYEWNDDNTKCTASVTCRRKDCGHIIKEDGVISRSTIVPAACEENGEDRLSVKFINERFVEQSKSVVTSKTGHKPEYIKKKDANCAAPGNIEYYCCTKCKKKYRDFECTEMLSDEDIIIPLDENAHDFGDVSYVWADDYSTVTASRKCKNDSTHVESETVKTTYAVVKEATDIADGLGVYVSDTFENKAFSVQRKEITIPSKGGAPKPETPEQKAEDGTDVGSGASEAVADRAIKSSDSDEGPAGSAFGLLQARMKKVTKNSITIGWKKVNGAKYVIYGNQCGKTRKFEKITMVNINKFTQKKLKKGTYYKYIIVAVKDGKVVSTSKTLHVATKGGKFTNHSKVKVKKKAIKLKKKKTYKIKTKLVKQSKKLKVQNHRKVKFESSNISVATVDNKGKIKAVGKGTAYVYAYAQDGICVKIKVTVK
ncbi:MAG: glycoside hydrolase family 9 protein [Eubacterium sp.]|nr:glycoside hydrolase family 9 protein [Eubacterium sp.]